MANLGKCVKCSKTCYGLEGFKVGAPGKEQTYHKTCFKCTRSSFALIVDLIIFTPSDSRFIFRPKWRMQLAIEFDQLQVLWGESILSKSLPRHWPIQQERWGIFQSPCHHFDRFHSHSQTSQWVFPQSWYLQHFSTIFPQPDLHSYRCSQGTWNREWTSSRTQAVLLEMWNESAFGQLLFCMWRTSVGGMHEMLLYWGGYPIKLFISFTHSIWVLFHWGSTVIYA